MAASKPDIRLAVALLSIGSGIALPAWGATCTANTDPTGNCEDLSWTSGSITNNQTLTTSANGVPGVVIADGAALGTFVNSAAGVLDTANFNPNALRIINASSVAAIINAGTMTSINGGTIDNSAGSTIASLSNTGTIVATGSGSAIINRGVTTVLHNAGSGVIDGAFRGIRNDGTITMLNNYGTINGTTFDGVRNDATNASISTLNNYGNISGGSTGINNVAANANITILSNFGTITGGIVGISNDRTIGTFTNAQSGLTYRGNAPASYLVSIASPGSYGTLVVTSTAGFGIGAMNFGVASGSTVSANNTYQDVIQTGAGGTTFNSTVTKTGAYITAGTRYDFNLVWDGVNWDLAFGDSSKVLALATTPNAIATVNGLGRYTGIDPALVNLQNTVLAISTTSEANRAGEQLRSEPHGATTGAAMQPVMEVMSVVAVRADNLRLARAYGGRGMAAGDASVATGDWAGWSEVFGSRARQEEHNNFDGYKAHSGGLVLAADKATGDDWRIGGVAAYAKTKVDDRGSRSGSNTKIDTYGLVGYASYMGQPWYLTVSGGVFQHQYDDTRVIDFSGFSAVATSKRDGWQYIAKVEGGYPMTFGERDWNATLTPMAGLIVSRLRQDGYTESGGNGAALRVDSSRISSIKSEAGLKLERGFATAYGDLVPDVRVLWRHEFKDDAQSSDASFAADATGLTGFTTVGPKATADSAVLSLGLTLVSNNDLTLSAKYEAELADNYVSHTGRLRARWTF